MGGIRYKNIMYHYIHLNKVSIMKNIICSDANIMVFSDFIYRPVRATILVSINNCYQKNTRLYHVQQVLNIS